MKLSELFKKRENAYIKGEDLTDFSISVDDAMQIPAFNSSINLICNIVSSVNFNLFKNDNGVIKTIEDKRTQAFNKTPNIMMTASELKCAIVRDYFIYGNSYVYINNMGDSLELNYIPVENINVWSAINKDLKSQEYQIIINGDVFYPHQFFILAKDSYNGIQGKGLIHTSREMLKQAFLLEKFINRVISKGGVMSCIVQAKSKLEKEALEQLRQQFDCVCNGKNSVLYMNDGISYTPIQDTNIINRLFDYKNIINSNILSLFNIHENLADTNVPDGVFKMLFRTVINPILIKIEQSLNRSLLFPKEKANYFWKADIDNLLQEDLKTRYSAYAIGIKNGILTRNEVRNRESLAAIDGLDIITLGLSDIIYNTENGDVYIPNIDTKVNILKGGEDNASRIKR